MNQIPAIIALSPTIVYLLRLRAASASVLSPQYQLFSWFSKSGLSAVLRGEVEVLDTMLRLRRPFTIYTLNFLGV